MKCKNIKFNEKEKILKIKTVKRNTVYTRISCNLILKLILRKGRIIHEI